MIVGGATVSHDQSEVAGVSRGATAVLGALGAFLIGGVAQTVVWRWGVDWLTGVTNTQFAWVLLCFFVAWGWSLGRLFSGVAAGAVCGFGLIASYYVAQWLVDGRHAAVEQLTESRGLAWIAASVVGGAGVGLLGALAASSAATRPRRKAFGLVGAAAILAGGPTVWLALRGDLIHPDGTLFAAGFFVCVGVALVVIAVRRCGLDDAIRGGVPAVAVALASLAGLFVLQHTWLYLTF